MASRASWSGGPVESGTVHVLHDEIGHALLDESVVEHHHVLVRGAAQRHGLLDDLPRRHGPVGVQGKLRGHGSETPAAEDLKRLRRAPEAPRPRGSSRRYFPPANVFPARGPRTQQCPSAPQDGQVLSPSDTVPQHRGQQNVSSMVPTPRRQTVSLPSPKYRERERNATTNNARPPRKPGWCLQPCE